jgi:hypothetical protein
VRNRKKPVEKRLDDLAWQHDNTLSVFEVAASSLERVAAEAKHLAEEQHVERLRAEDAGQRAWARAHAAESAAAKIRELVN